MSALRQTTEQAKAVTQGTVSNPAIEAVKNSKEAVGAELAAMPPMKYSRDGIPEGLDHVSEMERLRVRIQGGTASANDIDNYITLQTRAHNQAAQEFARSSEGNVVDMMGGPDEGGIASAGTAAGKASREVPAAEAAPAVRSSMRGGGAVRSSGMDRGQPSSAGVQPRPSSRGPVGGSKQNVVSPSAEAAPVKGKYKEEPSGNFNRIDPNSVKGLRQRFQQEPLTPQELRNPDGSPKDPRRARAEKVVREQELRKYSPEDRALMEEYSGAKDPEAARIAAAWEDSGANEVNLPKIVRTGGGFAANEMLMGQALKGARSAGAAASEGITRTGQRMGAGLETAKAMANRPAALKAPASGAFKVTQPEMPESNFVDRKGRAIQHQPGDARGWPAGTATWADVPPEAQVKPVSKPAPTGVNNNISRVPKPPGLQMLDNMDKNIPSSDFARPQPPNTRPGHAPRRSGAAQSARMTAEMADQRAAQAAQARAAQKPQPPSATRASHRASEYLEARDSGRLNQPKINVDLSRKPAAPTGDRFNAMQQQAPSRPSRPQRTEGYSVNTQTDAAVKRNSMSKAQRGATANKAAAAEVATEKKAAASKPKTAPKKPGTTKKKK
jgi:hypothetical protein